MEELEMRQRYQKDFVLPPLQSQPSLMYEMMKQCWQWEPKEWPTIGHGRIRNETTLSEGFRFATTPKPTEPDVRDDEAVLAMGAKRMAHDRTWKN